MSLFIPPWLLVSLPSCNPTTTVPKGVSLTLQVDLIAHLNGIDVRDHLDTWTRRFRRKSDLKLWGTDDLQGILPKSGTPKSLLYQLSVIDGAPDGERAVLQELGSYLEANSQV